MQTLTVDVGHSKYPITIGHGVLRDARLLGEGIRGQDLAIVTNATIAPLYLETVRASLAGRRIAECILPDGERYKTLHTAGLVFDLLVDRRMNRDATILALGGGVVGDIAGFAAACYQRGVGYVQMPTTLLAQVDSSVGGKTGVNHPAGKNMIGAFHQPLAVFADTDTLSTLPERELKAGLAEIIKYGCVWDADLFAWLELNMLALTRCEPAALAHAIGRSCEIKAAVVAQDERENDIRAILNFGHTFGHAIEAATRYEQYLHGEAVGLGMVMAADFSQRLGLIDRDSRDRVVGLLAQAGLPTETPRIGAAHAFELMQMDKKVKAGTVRLVIMEKLGRAAVASRYEQRALDAVLAEHFGVSELAVYAAHESQSRGRRHAEPKPEHRSEYQRDRDRIVHSTAFRRLVYKTQVFVNHEGDLYRTRLTHSLEVAQIARTIARSLELNEVLSEAICLAHDVGHTPFGHAGQDALDECMKEFGGFEHNLQSLRVVDELEEHYADFNGLNLSFECREGILKHCSYNNAVQLGDVGERFINRQQPSLEAQLANFADEIAYNNHDVDDGIRAGLISVEQLRSVPLFDLYHGEVLAKYPLLTGRRLVYEIVRRMINRLVCDLIDASTARLRESGVASIHDVRTQRGPLIGFSETARELNHELKTFLRDKVYKHYKVRRMTAKARGVVAALFEAFFEDPSLMPQEHEATARALEVESGTMGRARSVADYIAGMTDRYAILEHARLFDPSERT